MIKNKYFLFSLFSICLFFLVVSYAHAAEITYPDIPGLTTPKANCFDTTCLPTFMAYWFGLLVYLCGIVSLISFAMGAIGLISPNPESHGDAKDRMKSAILGLALTLASFLIISTINPTLTTLHLVPLAPTSGFFCVKASGQQMPCPDNSQDTTSIGLVSGVVGSGWYGIKYVCPDTGPGQTYFMWTFPKPNFEAGNGDLSGVEVKELKCGQTLSMGGSYRIVPETPGVYYCLGDCAGTMCSGEMSSAITSSSTGAAIDPLFKGKIKGVKIINNSDDGLYYGVIFHKAVPPADVGQCEVPIAPSEDDSCMPISITADSVDIFKVNYEPGASGDGVTFYSEPFGPDTGAKAGFANVPDNAIKWPYLRENLRRNNVLCYDYTKIKVPDTYKYRCSGSSCSKKSGGTPGVDCSDNACETFQECQGSIQIKGSYLVALYGSDLETGDLYCKTFQDVPKGIVPNLSAVPIFPFDVNTDGIDTVYIVPTQ